MQKTNKNKTKRKARFHIVSIRENKKIREPKGYKKTHHKIENQKNKMKKNKKERQIKQNRACCEYVS